MNIWIDLDNSPHVPFFAPIIHELERRGHTVELTARDAFQVRDLAALHGLQCDTVGRHYGKHKLFKTYGLCFRTLQLLPKVKRLKPDLAVSHGSRSQSLACAIAGTPSIIILDYEFAQHLVFSSRTWIMAPDVIPLSSIHQNSGRVLRYPGIKEDVYVAGFAPNPSIKSQLRLAEDKVVVTIRPPASEAHYRSPESDKLFHAAVEFVADTPGTVMVLLPRTSKQEFWCRQAWPAFFDNAKIIVPQHAVDGLNLIWHSDLVISGGGTMNREAAALGVPVYSIFRGRIGAVDQYLSNTGRLVLLHDVEELRTKLVLKSRPKQQTQPQHTEAALAAIVQNIVEVASLAC
jgi:hypothetical protein